MLTGYIVQPMSTIFVYKIFILMYTKYYINNIFNIKFKKTKQKVSR